MIPESITKIEYTAFAYCTSLRKIILPNNLTKLGRRRHQYIKKKASFLMFPNWGSHQK